MTALRHTFLSAQLLLAHSNWLGLLSYGISFAAIFLWLVVIPQWQTLVQMQDRQRQDTQAAISAPPAIVPLSAMSAALDQFYGGLGEKHYVEQQLKTLFALASKQGLVLAQAEYKLDYLKESRTYAYRVQLPLKGRYQAVRRFCELTLLSIPFAALDDIAFKKDGIQGADLEVKLHFTIFVSDRQPLHFSSFRVTDPEFSERWST